MSLPAQTFSQVTPEVFERLAASLDADYGIKISSDSGHVEHSGFGLDYDYNRANNVLVLTCTDKPFLIPKSVVQHSIVEHVSEAMTPKVI